MHTYQRLVEEEGIDVQQEDGHGATAMHHAAINGRIAAMVYMRICMYAHMYVYAYVCMHKCMYAHYDGF